jgi:hypothetical protein
MQLDLDRKNVGFLIQLLSMHGEDLAQYQDDNGGVADEWIDARYKLVSELQEQLVKQCQAWDAR